MNEYTGKYYVIEVAKYADGTADSKSIYTYDDEVSAVATFYKKMGGAMMNTNYAFELVQVINDYGVVIESKYFERRVEATKAEIE